MVSTPDPFQDPERVHKIVSALQNRMTQPWHVMEVCGGQTHSIVRYGLDQLLPEGLELMHGPGCPVCVTPIEVLDQAQELASQGHILCTFGDMLRVPGSRGDLFAIKARGGDVRMVYSPMDALALAQKNPDREVIFLAVGFETTAPANAMAAWQAHDRGLQNFSLLTSQVLVPPALELIQSSPENKVQAFLAAGHVCAVMGYHEYDPIAEKYQIPIVVTGFEPVDILAGLYQAVVDLENQDYGVRNAYSRVVTHAGNLAAQELLQKVFKTVDQEWRGLGYIPRSGWVLRSAFSAQDARKKFSLSPSSVQDTGSPDCMSGAVLQGRLKPSECPQFAVSCHPENPLGAPMVSSEGACAAYYRYRRGLNHV